MIDSNRKNGSTWIRRGILVRIIYVLVALIWWIVERLMCHGTRRNREVVVLCYHGVHATQRDRFSWQMRQIASRTIGAKMLSDAIDGQCIPRRVCVTFDDGFSNLLDNAMPILQELGIPAVVFPVVANLGQTPKWEMSLHHPDLREQVMSREEIVSAHRDYLCRIGSHTRTHPCLTRLSLPEVNRELGESKIELERITDAPIEDLALPYGSYDERILNRAMAKGYKRIFTLDPCVYVGQSSPSVIGRFLMSPDAWRIEFLLTCAGAYTWLGAWRSALHRVHAVFVHLFKRELPCPYEHFD